MSIGEQPLLFYNLGILVLRVDPNPVYVLWSMLSGLCLLLSSPCVLWFRFLGFFANLTPKFKPHCAASKSSKCCMSMHDHMTQAEMALYVHCFWRLAISMSAVLWFFAMCNDITLDSFTRQD